MRITVLAGGIGGARFLRGVRTACPDADITAVVNTGDDITLHGLRICPDLDSVMYALGDGIDTDRGWGRAEETWRLRDELAAYGGEAPWFGLGDLDIATHIVRTQMLAAGASLSQATARLCARWRPGVALLPMSDQPCETHVLVDLHGERRQIHFQQWWIELHASAPALGFVSVGVEEAVPAPGVLESLFGADVVLVAPSNPVVSIDTILAVPGLRTAVVAAPAPVIGFSPIIGGRPVRGMADACLPAIGVDVSAQGVGAHYGARSAGGILDAWLIDTVDAAAVPGLDVHAVPLYMHDDDATAAMVHAGLAAAGV